MNKTTERLLAEKVARGREIEILRAGLRRIRAYLTSSKFFEEPYVNIRDVLLRIEEIEEEASRA